MEKFLLNDTIFYLSSTMLRKVAVSTFLLAYSTYIFLPTPDELVIYPVAGLFLTCTFHLSVFYAALLITLVYYGSGTVSLIGAFLIGGRPIYGLLGQRIRKRRDLQALKRRKIGSF